MNLKELRGLAVRAVMAGMEVVRDWRDRGEDLGVRCTTSAGGPFDSYVTAADDAAEAAMTGVLRQLDPDSLHRPDVVGGAGWAPTACQASGSGWSTAGSLAGV